MPPKKKIIIIGAGPGGLTAGMILAKRGFDVHIYEKEHRIGGRNAELRVGDFVFDTGPTFLMMKFILDEVFEEAGEKSDNLLKFVDLDPMYRLVFKDFSLDVTRDPVRLKQDIARIFPGQENGYDKFMKKEAVRFEKIFACLQKDYSTLWAYLNPIFLKALPYIPLGRNIFSYLDNYFAPDKLRLSFTFQSKYLGMSPWECPAFFTILPYIEHKFGVFHVQGGLSKISDAMAQVFKKHGGQLFLGSPIEKIIVEKGIARGVWLKNGTTEHADEVIVNADFAHAMNTLVLPNMLKKYSPKKLAKKQYSCSTFMLYLGLDKVYTELPHHTIIFAHDYRNNTEDIFKKYAISKDDASIYIRNSTVTDPNVAPSGKSGLYILVPAPNNKSNINWDELRREYRERIISLIEERTPLSDVRKHIVAERVTTPDDWERSGVYLGATFNLAHSISQMLYFRPHNKFEEIDHMYLVGGGTHPGSGLPTIYESGRIAANMISKKYEVPFTAPDPNLWHHRNA